MKGVQAKNNAQTREFRKKWKSVEKKQTEIGKDYGLFVKENCKEGDLIIEYVGKVVWKINKSNSTVYLMTIFDKQLWIDATNMRGLAKFMNHSCTPNCKLQRWEVNGFPRMCFFAIKEIKEGDELNFDYHWDCDEDDQTRTECKCGTVNCKGFI